MPSKLSIHAEHQGDMRWTAATGAHSVRMDYPLQPGAAGEGMKPLEMILASLAACAGNTLVLLLQRVGQAFHGMEIDVRGQPPG